VRAANDNAPWLVKPWHIAVVLIALSALANFFLR
jgi:hypothetical protein